MTYKDRERRRLVIGTVLLAGLSLIIGLIIFLHDLAEAARENYMIIGVLYEVPRLRPGSKVQLAGYPVGEVTGIELIPPTDSMPPPFAARLRIPTALRAQLREDSRIELRRHRLMGETVVNLVPGTPGSRILEPGDTLYGTPPIQALDLLSKTAAIHSAIDSLLTEGEELHRRGRRLGALGDTIRWALADLRAEFEGLEAGLRAGPIADLKQDPDWREDLDRIMAMLGEIAHRAEARARAIDEEPIHPSIQAIAERAEALRERVLELGILILERGGFAVRWEFDPALRDAIEATRVELDSLIELTRRRPWRYFF